MNSSRNASNYDEISMQNSLQFADSLKDLRSLREQLYSAAEYFESSYDTDAHKQFAVETSKDYVAKALVNTVDHLGSVADKLNKFLDQKTDEFSETNTRFSCIEQRLNTFQRFIDSGGVSNHSLMLEAPKHHKQYIIPENFQFGKSNVLYENCISCPQYDRHQFKQDNSFSKAFQPSIVRHHPPLLRKGYSSITSSEISPDSLLFSFTRAMSKKETGKRSISPLRFPINRLKSVANRSVSPSPSENRQRLQVPPEPRRAVSVCRKPEINRERDVESYAEKSRHIFKAFMSIHRTRKD